MDLQRLSETCFEAPIDLFHANDDELLRDLQRRCLSALVEATDTSAARWRPGSVLVHRSASAAIAVGPATTTGWVERIADDGRVVFRVVARSPTGVECADVSVAFDAVRTATWCECVLDASSVANARKPAQERKPSPARRHASPVADIDMPVAATAGR